jgi:hypothetical protein
MQVSKFKVRPRVTGREYIMELQLQFGYGMMDHSRSLVSAWGGGTVILSPRDLSPEQLERLATEIGDVPQGKVLLDPQFYLPHADHERLTSHDYWPSNYSTGSFWTGADLRQLLKRLLALNAKLGCEQILLPGLFAERVDDDWLERQKLTIDEALALTEGLSLFATVALGADAIRSDEDMDEVLAAAEKWAVDGIYLVCEHPRGEYLVTDPTWLANVLDLSAGLRLKSKKVVVGYCNHQMLSLAAAGASAIASGTWMNVRCFPPDKFRVQYDDEIKQRAIWYYCPQALSEYKVAFLDIAKKQGVLAKLSPPKAFGSDYADALFLGAQPTSVRWSEQAAFRHYLQSLNAQVRLARGSSFDTTVDQHERSLDDAEQLLNELHSQGIRGQLRDFHECVDASRAALGVLRANRGAQLRRKWSAL